MDADGPRDAGLRGGAPRRRDRVADGARPAQRRVAADRLAELLGIARPRRGCRRRPGRPRPSRSPSARHGSGSAPAAAAPGQRRGREQRAGLGALVVGELDAALSHSQAWPATMPSRHADRRGRRSAAADSQPLRAQRQAARQRLEGQHDQRVAGQHRQPLAEGPVHRGLAAPQVGASSKQGRSSWTSEAQCSSSIAAAAASDARRVVVAAGARRRRQAEPAAGCARRRETPHGAAPSPSRGGQPGCLGAQRAAVQGLLDPRSMGSMIGLPARPDLYNY